MSESSATKLPPVGNREPLKASKSSGWGAESCPESRSF